MNLQLKAALIVVIAVFVAIQFVPGIGRTNPTEHAVTAPPPPEVQQVLRRACYDCHSNETEWPTMSRVAPIGWAVERQVYGARSKMNFSFWPDDPHGQAIARQKIGQMIAAGRMPLRSYRLVNDKGRLTDQEVQLLEEWANAPVPTSPLHEAAMRGGRAAVVR